VDGHVGLVAVAGIRIQAERTTRLLAAAEGLLDTIGASLSSVARFEYGRQMTRARAVLSAEALGAAWAEGRAMTLEQTVEYALASGRPSGTV